MRLSEAVVKKTPQLRLQGKGEFLRQGHNCAVSEPQVTGTRGLWKYLRP